MKRFEIDWETCFCEDFPEKIGTSVIEAETEEEAKEIFYKNTVCTIIMNIKESEDIYD